VIAPHLLTASDALRAIRRRELGVAEYVQALLDRIEALEPSIAAWELVDEAGAMDLARARDRRTDRGSRLALHGLPIALKDIYFTKGITTTAGFGPWSNHVPDHDASTVERLREAGAIVLGKTVTTQFAFADPPRTHNPWNPERTPGGSSSGSAAAVAARMVPVALGSQTAGSILRPAAYCGVLGLKPTYGLVSRYGIVPLAWSLDHPGPIARSVEDLALVLQVLAGPDQRDPATASARVANYLAAVRTPRGAPTIGVVDDVLETTLPDVAECVAESIESLAKAGATLRRIRLPIDLPTIVAAQQTIMQVEAAEVHANLHLQHADQYAPRMRALIETGALVPAMLYLRAQRIRHQFRRSVEIIFRDVDCLAMPTASNVAPTRDTTGDRRFQAPWSLLGVPAVTLPCGLADGLPIGLQLVASYWQEARLLTIAAWIEGILPAIQSPPGSSITP
jgi:aspartyl-tRNA(Asn)/glutamyl-tRNA(Gln) amidotransferase subunit A